MGILKSIVLFYRLYTGTFKSDKQLTQATILTRDVFHYGEKQLKKYGLLSSSPNKATTEKQWQKLKGD